MRAAKPNRAPTIAPAAVPLFVPLPSPSLLAAAEVPLTEGKGIREEFDREEASGLEELSTLAGVESVAGIDDVCRTRVDGRSIAVLSANLMSSCRDSLLT
jgi:hypothetical protein